MTDAASTSAIRQAMEQRTKDFLLSYETAAKKNDPSIISIHLAPNCRRTFAPVSFIRETGLAPDFAFNNADYQSEYEKHMPIWSVKSTDVYNVTIDAEGRKSAARVSYHGEFSDGETLQMDFAWFLDFNETGTEITNLVEFVDTPDSMKHWHKAKELEEKFKNKEKE